jgi:hypothetical protein
MQPANLPEKVYHGTDARSAASIRQIGLDEPAWKAAAGGFGPDFKGFSVTTNKSTAEDWARTRATERGDPSGGMVLEADANQLPLRTGGAGQWTDPGEFFIALVDFPKVGPGVFR